MAAHARSTAPSADGQDPATVIPLWNDVVLDDVAIGAERRAQLAELAAEWFETWLDAEAPKTNAELAATRHLVRGARLAREAADRERERCAATYDSPGHGLAML